MQLIRTISELRTALNNQTSVSFVPTMGNLHAGHLHLVDIAKQHGTCVVVSIFVNPLQFGANEDLSKYPRSLEVDCKMLQAAGTTIVFVPDTAEIYPAFDGENLHQTMLIKPPAIADDLCGKTRPGHFAGVATIVMKLFNIVRPDVAIFGKKDFQQLLIIKQMVNQFNMPIKIIACETVREANGLAMSSRNNYLSAAQRSEAPRLYKTLKMAVEAIKKGNHTYEAIELQTTQYLTQLGWMVDYVSIRSAQTLLPATTSDKALIVLAAAKLDSSRLIDNIELALHDNIALR